MSAAYGNVHQTAGYPDDAGVTGATHIRPGFKRLVLIYLWLVIASSCIVYIEPAPYDVLLLGAIILLPVAGLVALPRSLSVYLLAVCGIAAGGYVAATQAGILDVPVKHVTITLYLALSSVLLAGFVAYNPAPHARLLMSGYVAAGLVASSAAIIGYFNIIPSLHETLTEYGRASGTFKDPNVLGAFLVPPVLYALNGVLNRPVRRALLWGCVFFILGLALMLTFSRGAWINAAVGMLAFGFLAFVTSDTTRKRMRLVLLGIVACVAAGAALAVVQTIPEVSEIFSERASFQQSYDLGPEGRFGGQQKAAALVVDHPLGIGALEFARVHHPEDVHQVYLNMFLNTGWFGGTLYIFLILATLWMALRTVLRRNDSTGISAVLFGAMLGLVVEGFVVDTDHWRHFFLVMGMIWGVAASPKTASAPQ